MSLFGALTSGVTGLFSQSQTLGIIADNISNVNTVGYKATSSRFSTLVTVQGSTTKYAPGGVQSIPLREYDVQGLLQGSTSPTDIAVSGAGFFVVNDSADGLGDILFTRAGSFRTDKDGNLVNTGGFYLTGLSVCERRGTANQCAERVRYRQRVQPDLLAAGDVDDRYWRQPAGRSRRGRHIRPRHPDLR